MKGYILVAIVFSLLAGSLHAEGLRRAGGWIDSFDGSAGSYVLTRGGKQVPVAIYMPVYVGDTIEVGKDGTLRIGHSDGTFLDLDQPGKPFIVSEPDDSVTLLDNFLEWAGEWFSKYTSGGEQDQAISMMSRGDASPPISMSLFPTGQAWMRAGKRTVALYWEGGVPPFGIRLHANDKPGLLVDLAGIETGKAVLGPLDLPVGSYDLEVYDRDKIEIVRLAIVPDERYPSMPEELAAASMPGKVIDNLEAMWLASQENGNWVLEAYQLIVDAGNEPSAASILRTALEKGIVPER